MAIEIEKITNKGITRYHRLMSVRYDYTPDPAVQGSVGRVYAELYSYASEDARRMGEQHIDTVLVQIRFGAKVSEKLIVKGWPTEPVPITAKVFDPISGEYQIVKTGEKLPPPPVTVPVIRNNEPTRADIYEAVKLLPEYQDSQDG